MTTQRPRPTVFLFDIDGTLISSGGVARRCIEQAFLQRYGRADTLARSFGGMTDRAIIGDAVQRLHPELDAASLEAEIDGALDTYLAVLKTEAHRSLASFRIHRGIELTLERLAHNSHCAVGLGTGNVKEGAHIKLQCVGLQDHFPFGGFGCDHVERARLLRIGAERGAAHLHARVEECRVVVIGDTTKDIAAAHAIGAECVAVTTGACERSALEALQPKAVFQDLAHPDAFSVLVGP